MHNHYQVLNVRMSADLATIKKAYHKISLLHHPDKTIHLPATERSQREHLFKLANLAFEVLSDPQKRKIYDQSQNIGPSHLRDHGLKCNAQPPDGYKPQNDRRSHDNRRMQESRHTQTPRSSTARAGSTRDSDCLQSAPLRSHRFSTTTLGTPPDHQWYHSEIVETSDRTTMNFSNWLGWRFSVGITSRFKMVARPIIPEKQLPEIMVIRFPLQRVAKQATGTLEDVAIDLRGNPGSKHTVLCPTLIEAQEGLELRIEIVALSEGAQKEVRGPNSWNWAFDIDHEPLLPSMRVKATNLVFCPYYPSFGVLPNGKMPTAPYPGGSPMRGLVNKFPGIMIKEPVSNTYCKKEEQPGKTFWRLTAVGCM